MFLALKRWCNKVFIYGVIVSRVRTRHAGVYVGVMHANESKKKCRTGFIYLPTPL